MKHNSIPTKAGRIIEINVHFKLFVSFFMVKTVVRHGQCIRVNIIVQIAVFMVHPLSMKSFFKSFKLLNSVMYPSDI